MKKALFPIMIFAIIVVTGCNQSSKNNSQSGFGPGNGGGPGNFDPKEMIARQMDQMKEQLDLSRDQQKQLQKIMEEGFENMRKMRQESRSNGDREGMREHMRQMREEQDQKIKAILSEEQWGKYQQIREEMRSRRRGGPGGTDGGQGRPDEN